MTNNFNSISPNQLLDPMSMPPYMMPRDQENKQAFKKRLQLFWERQINIQLDEGVKSPLPPSRIKKIMKTDAEMVSGDSPSVLGKSCEFFIQELICRSWMKAQDANKRTLKSFDIAKAIFETDIFDFIIDIGQQYNKDANAGNFAQETQLNARNYAEGNQLNAGNFVGNQYVLPHTASFVGNPMINMGINQMATNQQNVGNQIVLPHATGLIGNSMLNMENNQLATYQQHAGNFTEGNQASLPHVDGLMGNPMMSMENDQVFPQPYMMQPSFNSNQIFFDYHMK